MLAMAAAAGLLGSAGALSHDSIPISDVQALTLQEGRLTTGRRSSPISQLSCAGGHCAKRPAAVRCVNAGSDGVDAQWDCTAELDSTVKFGQLDVQCEGFDYPDDPSILVGSCGLTYTLVPTGRAGASSSFVSGEYGSRSGAGDGGGLFGGILFLGLIVVAASACGGSGRSYHSPNMGYGYGASSYGYGGGGGGFGAGVATGALAASAFSRPSYRSSGWGGGGGGGGGWSGGGGGTHRSTGFSSTSRR